MEPQKVGFMFLLSSDVGQGSLMGDRGHLSEHAVPTCKANSIAKGRPGSRKKSIYSRWNVVSVIVFFILFLNNTFVFSYLIHCLFFFF